MKSESEKNSIPKKKKRKVENFIYMLLCPSIKTCNLKKKQTKKVLYWSHFLLFRSHFLLNKHNLTLFREKKFIFQRIFYSNAILIIDNFKMIEVIPFIYLGGWIIVHIKLINFFHRLSYWSSILYFLMKTKNSLQ